MCTGLSLRCCLCSCAAAPRAPSHVQKGKDAKGIKKKEEPKKKAPPPDPKAKKGKKDEPGHAMESEEETRLRLQGEYRDRADTEAKQIMVAPQLPRHLT